MLNMILRPLLTICCSSPPFQLFDIVLVNRPAHGSLVFDQVIITQDFHNDTIQIRFGRLVLTGSK